jgi:hypothetical protein
MIDDKMAPCLGILCVSCHIRAPSLVKLGRARSVGIEILEIAASGMARYETDLFRDSVDAAGQQAFDAARDALHMI